MSDWIEWKGGECPLPDGTAHQIKFRTGAVVDDPRPETWCWEHDGSEEDIIAYRVVPS